MHAKYTFSPSMNTVSCELKHTVYIISGEMRVRMDDGSIHTHSNPG